MYYLYSNLFKPIAINSMTLMGPNSIRGLFHVDEFLQYRIK